IKGPSRMDLGDYVTHFSLPLRDPHQARPRVTGVSFAGGVRYRARRARRRGGRRLAYLDSMFPWMRSGFRYQEARALLELAPDTRFFSLWELTDPFPAPVQPLAQFPRIAARDEITDAYGVFQLFLAGLVGMRPSGE